MVKGPQRRWKPWDDDEKSVRIPLQDGSRERERVGATLSDYADGARRLGICCQMVTGQMTGERREAEMTASLTGGEARSGGMVYA